MLTSAQFYSVMILSALSFLSGIALVVAYVRLSSLRKPPGMLVLYQCLAQLVIDAHWLATASYQEHTGHVEPSDTCWIHGLISVYFFFLALNYVFCIGLEVINKLRSPMENSYQKRVIVMHSLSHTFCGVLIILLAVRGGTGQSVLQTCFIKAGTWGDYLMLLPIFFYCPFSLIIVMYAFIMYRKTRILKRRIFLLRFSMIVFLYEICWAPISFMHVTKSGIVSGGTSHIEVVAWVMGSLAGLTVNLIRIFDSAIVNRVKRHFRRQEASLIAQEREQRISLPNIQQRANSLLDTEIYKFFQDVFLEGVISSFMSLSLTYDKLSHLRPNKRLSVTRLVSQLAAEKRIFFLGRHEIESCKYLDDVTKRQFHNYEVKVTEYGPELFSHLRDLEGVSCTELLESFNPTVNKPLIKQNAGNRGGRSDAFISFSVDKKFLMKTLTRGEKSFLLDELLPVYYEHVLSKYSVLARILGVFSLEDNRKVAYDLIIMVNVIGTMDITTLFDLKGSKIARQTMRDGRVSSISELPRGKTYKDLDFLQTAKTIEMSQDNKNYLLSTLKGDVEMLTSMNVMDYSMLVAFTPCVDEPQRPRTKKYAFPGQGKDRSHCFYIGIIDYLQVYNRFKRLETLSKTIVNPRNTRMDISAVSPSEYSERFLGFVSQILGLTDESSSDDLDLDR